MDDLTSETWLKPREVGRLFGVDPATVKRWAYKGLIGYAKTPGGHFRFRESEVRGLLERQD